MSNYSKPRHQLTRSISELSAPIRRHSHRRSNDKEKHRDRDPDVDRDRDDRIPPPPAAPPSNARLSLDTPNLSPNPSRRASLMISAAGDDNIPLLPTVSNTTASKMAMPTPAPPVLKEAELRREKQIAEAQESGLKKTLLDVATSSNATTSRLDNAYYSVLEKVGTLQSTLIALRELTAMSHELNNTFSRESSELKGDISAQLKALGAFEDQQARVEMLQGRVRKGHVRVGALSERLDNVLHRIEGWERADREWQERTRRRLRVIWVVVSTLAFVVILLFIGAQYAPDELHGLEAKAAGFANESISALKNMSKGAAQDQGQTPWDPAGKHDRDGHLHRDLNATVSGHVQHDEAEEMLRIFDEL